MVIPLDRAGGSDTVRISPSKSDFKAARNAPETSGGDVWVTDERENAEKMTDSKERGREAVKYVLGIFPTSEEQRLCLASST